MFEYKLLVATEQQDMEGFINQWAKTEGWRVKSLLPPSSTSRKHPRSKWYATLERRLLRLEWAPGVGTDLAGYKLYVSKTPPNGVERKWTLLAIMDKEIHYYDVPLGLYEQPNTEYAFSVSVFDIAGNSTKQSIIATVQR